MGFPCAPRGGRLAFRAPRVGDRAVLPRGLPQHGAPEAGVGRPASPLSGRAAWDLLGGVRCRGCRDACGVPGAAGAALRAAVRGPAPGAALRALAAPACVVGHPGQGEALLDTPAASARGPRPWVRWVTKLVLCAPHVSQMVSPADSARRDGDPGWTLCVPAGRSLPISGRSPRGRGVGGFLSDWCLARLGSSLVAFKGDKPLRGLGKNHVLLIRCPPAPLPPRHCRSEERALELSRGGAGVRARFRSQAEGADFQALL